MGVNGRAGHLQCPFCESYEVSRLYLASLRADSCVCAACGAQWDEDPSTGEYLGRAGRDSVATPTSRGRAEPAG